MAGGLVVGSDGASTTFSGIIAGETLSPVDKVGSRALTLAGQSTYTGGMRVLGGTLSVTGGPLTAPFASGRTAVGNGQPHQRFPQRRTRALLVWYWHGTWVWEARLFSAGGET